VTDRRLIEEEIPLEVINVASGREKSLRHGHISTLHLWWARRPLSMSRAVAFASLLPDPGDEGKRRDINNRLAYAAEFESSNDPSRMDPLRGYLRAAYPDKPPRVLDCFAGGGAIPLESLRLGFDTVALDLNPVANLILRCVLEYPERFGSSIADDFVKWAGWIEDSVTHDLADVFSTESEVTPSVYFWCRTMRCPNPACAITMPLVSSRWLAQSPRRKVWIDLVPTSSDVEIKVVQEGSPSGDPSDGTMRASSALCPRCGTSVPATEVRAYGKKIGLGSRLYAVLEIDDRVRTYREPTDAESLGAETLAANLLAELPELADGTSAVPDEDVTPSQFRILRSLVYGINSFAGMFNTRQLYVLGRLSHAVRQAHDEMLSTGMEAARAKAVATYLGLCVDRIADYNSSFCGWHVTGEKVRNTFPRQAIGMAWDFTEIDPFGSSSGNWTGAVRWIDLVIRHCAATSDTPAEVVRGNAQSLPFDDASFDAVIVDPPYYDAIQYGDLSDFFYVWLKRSIGHLYPELFPTPLTPKQQEVIENRADKKSPEYISHDEFELRLQRALNEMARVLKRGGIMSLVFAHTDVEAWERLLRALRAAGLVVSTSWPMRSELANRPAANLSAVLVSSVVLVCRRASGHGEGFYDDVVRELEERIASRLDRFERMGLVGADYFASAVGPAFEVFAQYSKVVRLSGEEVDVSDLMVLARRTVARHAMRRLLGDESIQTLDGTSLLT
jgi:putative DNA methylase